MTALGKVLVGLLIAGGVLTVCMIVLLVVLARVSRRSPPELGVTSGELKPCPNSPNCVSTQSEDPRHAIAPIPYAGSLAEAKTTILDVAAAIEGATIVTQDSDYVHVEVYVRGFGFVDDVEFAFDEEAQVIHFRSSSRVPYYDYDLNRKRMEGVRTAFEAASN